MPPKPEQLRALSIRQPWAELILRGEKTVEYRSQPTHIRGRVYIYASLAKPEPGDQEFDGDLARGMIVGTVEIADCEGSDGEYGWHLENAQRLDAPLSPNEQPQPVWFYPFGHAEDQYQGDVQDAASAQNGNNVSDGTPSATRFAPVIAATKTPPFTPYHSKYLAYELTKRVGADQADKLAQSLCNATVDLNPHQVDAALFAFRSPLSRGAILADEVGLGKTIEAGIIISQLWAEKKRRVLVIAPASLRKQWSRELAEKFFIPSFIMEAKSFREASRKSTAPFQQPNQVVICSYQFARARATDIATIPWDLVTIDEAHRLRNVYKKDNKIARAIRDAVRNRPKVLLTATPLQNSLMELFGLVTFVDEHVFGSEDSFRELYGKKSDGLSAGMLANLRARLAPICQRTLRKQVLEYVRYTKRIPITEDFTPSDDERRLYESVSAYLQRDNLHALPNSQRQLIELILRKILASSSFAIAATLGTMISRLQKLEQVANEAAGESASDVVGEDFEQSDSLEEEWQESQENTEQPPGDDKPKMTPAELLKSIRAEAKELAEYKTLAESITQNAKGESLLRALRLGFAKAGELGSRPKALIFTESRRTQMYLLRHLEANGYVGQIVLFNGTNTDPDSKRMYREWMTRHEGQDCVSGSPTADMRSALVDEFAERASIMIATESAAEGVNLQFCSLVVNFDLPWNPQRIEQRIGRCHRYGQQHDVVVINFVNRANEADQRVFVLLNEKFKLFDGVFGASDEVLGALESGIDIEKRINEIYKRCRTAEEIQKAFDKLQADLDVQITSTLQDARTKLLENFDEDVHHKLRITQKETQQRLDRYGDWLWALTATELDGHADFEFADHHFTLKSLPAGLPPSGIPLGVYRLHPPQDGERGQQGSSDFHHFRPGHPLAESLVAQAKIRALPSRELHLDYTRRGARISLVERLRGRSGWLRIELLTVSSLDTEESILISGITDDGTVLDRETCEKLLTIPAESGAEVVPDQAALSSLESAVTAQQGRILADTLSRNEKFFDSESDKLDHWADDLKESLERELKSIEIEIRDAKKAKRLAADLQSKIAAQKLVNDLEQKRNLKKRSLFTAQDEIEQKKDSLIADVEARLQQQASRERLFTIRWNVR